jgi:hypothetical protein
VLQLGGAAERPYAQAPALTQGAENLVRLRSPQGPIDADKEKKIQT